MTIRMIGSDIDGTLLRSDGSMSDRTVAALTASEEAGLLVVLCTGRPPRWMKPIAELTGHHGIAVCANGAIVYDLHTEQIVEEFPLDAEVARLLTGGLRGALPDVVFAVERSTGMLHEAAYIPWNASETLGAELEELLREPMAKLIAKHPTMSGTELHKLANEVIDDLAELAATTYSGPNLLEISAAGITKAFGLERVAAEHGITAADAIAFGDMPNDAPLIQWAGRGVAVANAHPDIIAIADEVTASNDDDGVALVIERELARLPGR